LGVNARQQLAKSLIKQAVMSKADFLKAIESGNLKTVLTEIENGAGVNQIDEHGTYPLHIAAQNNQIEIVEKLLEAGADVNALTKQDGWSALHFAATRGYNEIAKMLIDAGTNVSVHGLRYKRTCLHYAADQGRNEVVKLLLKAGANKDALDINNDTALSLAERKGHEETAKLLR
jgi:ankyrin repeat protein